MDELLLLLLLFPLVLFELELLLLLLFDDPLLDVLDELLLVELPLFVDATLALFAVKCIFNVCFIFTLQLYLCSQIFRTLYTGLLMFTVFVGRTSVKEFKLQQIPLSEPGDILVQLDFWHALYCSHVRFVRE